MHRFDLFMRVNVFVYAWCAYGRQWYAYNYILNGLRCLSFARIRKNIANEIVQNERK